MLRRDNFSEEHIREMQRISHRDPLLLERSVFAFGLLEALATVGLPFIFKGGTCLMLLLDYPRRLSLDIDIIVEPGTDLDEYLVRASEIFPFKGVQEQSRIRKSKIEKRHFKFTYDSHINKRPLYILLDVVFERNIYSELVSKEIRNDLLLTEPEYIPVTMPSVNCILADKLTAFAPHTTGIRLNIGKDMEVMKQFYDITSLLDVFTDFKQILPTYEKISSAEIAYRDMESNITNCLWDTFDAALCIASRGKVHEEDYPVYVKGIRDLRGFIYAENYSSERAAGGATKIMYLAACLLSNTEFRKAEDYTSFQDIKIEQERLISLRHFRRVNPEAYAYTIKTDRLLSSSQIIHCIEV